MPPSRYLWCCALLLLAVAAATHAHGLGSLPALAGGSNPDPLACGSLVVVRCRQPFIRQSEAGETAAALERARVALAEARAHFYATEFERIVITGERTRSKAELLREQLQGAAPMPGMSFRSVQNADGTLCTCATAPCFMNCCVCSK